MNAGSIDAVLTLNATGFEAGLNSSLEAVATFKDSLLKFPNDVRAFSSGLKEIDTDLEKIASSMSLFNKALGDLSNLKSLGQFLKNLSNSLKTLSSDSINFEQSVTFINSILQRWGETIGSTTLKVEGLATAVRTLVRDELTSRNSIDSNIQATNNFRNSYQSTINTLLSFGKALNSENTVLMRVTNAMKQYEVGQTNVQQSVRSSIDAFKSQYMQFEKVNAEAIKSREALLLYRNELQTLAMGVAEFNAVETGNTARLRENQSALNQVALADERVASMKQRLAMTTNEGTVTTEKNTEANNRNTQSMNRQANATKGLRNALSSLKMMGTMVASMFAYNFAHKLLMATTETVHAKSEMEGYFKMLNFSQSEVNDFNSALDETVRKFQRVNKYSLGETISSIGVEFNLTTEEMKKAMDVTSMVTSEYLRAGRNANEASLAVKDVLQGQFQRLSRETGVKGEQLKDAGWSGDTNDVLGLMEALEKVGKSRNWDVFASKANSLNDIITILQNRFGEWSADMVNVVQPTIVNTFNAMMSVGQGFANVFSGVWKWLNSSGWGQTATKVGLLTSAIMLLMPSLTAFRSGSSLLTATNMSLGKSLTALIFGINAETMALTGSNSAIGMKILGLKAEEVAEFGVGKAIAGKILGLEAEAITTAEATLVNDTFVGSLYAMITGEALAEAETLSLSGAVAILSASFLTSPIGWFTLAIIGLGTAIYGLTGGFDSLWSSLQNANKAVEDSASAIKPYQDYVNQTNKELEEAKAKYGENSLVVQGLTEKYNNATESLDAYYLRLQKTTNMHQKLNDELGVTSAKMDEIMREKLGTNFSSSELDSLSADIYDLEKLNDHDYVALQRHNYNLNEYGDALDSFADKAGNDTEAIKEFNKTYAEFIDYGDKANTADNWWDWATNSFMMGLTGKSLDIQKALKGDWDTDDPLGKLLEDYNLKGFTDSVTQWLTDLDSTLSSKNLGTLFDKNITQPILDFFGGIDQWITDGLKSLGEIDILGAIWDAILPQGVSASDGSSDHPSFSEDLSNIVGFDIQSWVTNFNSDPLGTLGIEIPQLDIWGLLSSLFGGGSDNGDGGFDIGGWLSSVFNIDGIVASFTTNLGTIFSTAQSIATNVSNVFNGLKSNIQGHLTNIVTNTSNGFENVKSNAISKMSAMRDSVGNVIHQMTDAWVKMKDSILHSAQLILDGVRSKFDSVKNTLSDFFSKLQNPASWGSAGQERWSRSPRPSTARRIFSPRSTGGRHGAGLNPYTNPSRQVKLRDLFDLVDGDNMVQLSQFLALFSQGGFGGWDFHKASLDKIYDTGKKWKTAPAHIQGIGSVGNGYQVGRFWNGRPKFTFDEFLATAEAIFSAIPYKFYYDSEWKGNWVNALLSGATNCSDGSDALIALASVFGFSGSKVHTTTKDGTGHFYAIINGRKMDTTHFQHGGGWSPLGGAGVSPRPVHHGKTVNITVDMSNATVYGIEDLDSRIEDGVKKGLREEFNDPYSIAL